MSATEILCSLVFRPVLPSRSLDFSLRVHLESLATRASSPSSRGHAVLVEEPEVSRLGLENGVCRGVRHLHGDAGAAATELRWDVRGVAAGFAFAQVPFYPF